MATNAEAYRSLSQQLSALTDVAAADGFWRDADPTRSVGFYSVSLLNALFLIDNEFAARDHDFVNAVFRSDKGAQDTVRHPRAATHSRNDLHRGHRRE